MGGANPTQLTQTLSEARYGFGVALVFSVFMNLLMLVLPLYMMQVYDRVLASGRTETLLLLSLMAGLAIAALAALQLVRARLLGRLADWLARRLGERVIAASLAVTLRGGGPGAQPLRDLDQLRGFLGGSGVQPLLDAPWTPVFLLVIWLLHPWLGLLAGLSAIALLGLAALNDRLTRRPLQAANQAMLGAYGEIEAALRNAEVVQAMGLLPALLERFRRQGAQMLAGQARAGRRGAAITGLTRFVRLAVQIAILGLGAWLVLQDQLTAGGMVAASILLGRALAPVEQAIGAWKALIAARASRQRLQQLLAAAPEPPAGLRLPAPAGRLAVERLGYLPPGAAKPVLRGLGFALEPGEVLGLVGPTAAGKSTLCRLLVGALAPSEGHVRLDAADVHSWERAEFGRHVGYLPQDVELFAGSVAENIARLGPAPAEAIVAAAQLAGVHEMILHLPQGYQTEIGPSGARLSGGQRQRLGLARALFGQPRLLVLDEPNANLDQQGEEALVAAIERVKRQGATVVMVAHRPNVLRCVDKLLLLRNGAIELFGERDAIMAQIAARARPEPGRPGRRRELAQAAG